MTAQTMEKLIYKGEKLSMAAEPLRSYLETRPDIHFAGIISSCWRGYVGTWKIENDNLLLIELSSMSTENTMDTLFPGKDSVLADWFTGEIRVPIGEQLLYVHMGYGSLYEKDLIFTVDKGVIVNKQEIDYRHEYEKLTDTEKYKLGQTRKQNS